MSFKGKNVVITGASSGIGAALAKEFASQGANVALLARRTDRLHTLEQELKAAGVKAVSIACDVTKADDQTQAFAKVREALGPADVVIANAGFGVVGKVENLTIEDFHRQFDTNVYGVIRTAQAALPDLRNTKGHFAVIGSVNGFVSLPGNSPYGMSKAAVKSFTHSLRHEWLAYGISVTHIAPGYVVSEIRSVDNYGKHNPNSNPVQSKIRVPADVAAREIINAIRRRKAERVITGHGKLIVFIARHFPRLFDWGIKKAKIQGRPSPA